MNGHSNKSRYPANLKLVGFDIDGVFTDGRFYLSDDGIESKSFFTQDGFGIRQLMNAGIQVAVISGRQSIAVDRRMAELGVKYVEQGCKDKVMAFDTVADELGVRHEETAYVGDDVPDIKLLKHVGFAIAVANAVPEVKSIANAVTIAMGGAGAVREVCDRILSAAGN
ncbi:MAG: HAD-IIIA family hydrolase [Pseudomonadota bacterium]|nr:HAD-IIIA family hydrolase [Pseudomonadota bacterium]